MTTTEVDYHLAAIARHLECLAEPRRMSLSEVLLLGGLPPSSHYASLAALGEEGAERT